MGNSSWLAAISPALIREDRVPCHLSLFTAGVRHDFSQSRSSCFIPSYMTLGFVVFAAILVVNSGE